jgi:hypothetical protein
MWKIKIEAKYIWGNKLTSFGNTITHLYGFNVSKKKEWNKDRVKGGDWWKITGCRNK